MSWFSIVLSLAIISVLEAASYNYVRFFGVGPELVLLGIIYFSLNSSKEAGVVCGFIGGIFKIAFSGMHPLILMVYVSIGFVAGLFKEALYKQLPSAQIIISFVSVLSSSIIYNTLISSRGFPYYKTLFFLSVPAAVYTSLLAPVLFWILDVVVPMREFDYKEIVFKKRAFDERRPQ